jgi:hypothetical protein
MESLYTLLERVLIRVFGLYLLVAAWIVIDQMMANSASELSIILVAVSFAVFWFVGGVITPALVKRYELNKLMQEIEEEKNKRGKRKNEKK